MVCFNENHGLGRRVRTVVMQGSGSPTPVWNPVSDNGYIWNGNSIAEELDTATGNVTKRFFAEGELRPNGVSYHYTRDHLGSIRELTDENGAARVQYDYDPYGVRTKLSGDANLESDFGFTGYWHDAPSGLDLSLYRPYKSLLGRWISRDPIGEAGGTNLYTYVHNNSENAVDPFGLRDIYVVIWNPASPYFWGTGSVGHVAALEMNGKVLSSQFPIPPGPEGPNRSLTYIETLATEGRDPDATFKVFVPDDAKFDASIRDTTSRPEWLFSDGGGRTTNCENSVADALKAGGVPVDRNLLPSQLRMELNILSIFPNFGHQWRVTPTDDIFIPLRP